MSADDELGGRATISTSGNGNSNSGGKMIDHSSSSSLLGIENDYFDSSQFSFDYGDVDTSPPTNVIWQGHDRIISNHGSRDNPNSILKESPLSSRSKNLNGNDNDDSNDSSNDQAANPHADSKKKGKVSFGSDVTFRQKTERRIRKREPSDLLSKRPLLQETDSIVIQQKESVLSHHFYTRCRYSIAFFGGHGVRYYCSDAFPSPHPCEPT